MGMPGVYDACKYLRTSYTYPISPYFTCFNGPTVLVSETRLSYIRHKFLEAGQDGRRCSHLPSGGEPLHQICSDDRCAG